VAISNYFKILTVATALAASVLVLVLAVEPAKSAFPGRTAS
jgi:hypothetical protein